MQTFTQRVERAARKAYREDVLPALKLSADDIARQGLNSLQSDATVRGLTGFQVTVEYRGPHKEEPHQQRLLKMVLRRVPVDVRVSSHDGRFHFNLAEAYSSGTGSREYIFPFWRMSDDCVHHNLEFLKKRKKWSQEIEAFTLVLEYFDCKSGTGLGRGYREASKPPSLNIKIEEINWQYLFRIVLEWALKNPLKIMELHRVGSPDETYSQIDVADYRSNVDAIQAIHVAGLAKLDSLLP